MNRIILLLLLMGNYFLFGQDTFSIVAVDPVTKEVGSAGASCVDLTVPFSPYNSGDFIGVLVPGKGAINTQAFYNSTNQTNATTRMLAGDSPEQIINWLISNDVTNTPQIRQYGVVDLNNGIARVKAFTGTDAMDYKGHIEGLTYSIQGNILLGKKVLDSIEARFNREQGSLACKLMAALQGAKMAGADSRCAANGTSSLFAYLKVSKPGDEMGTPSILLHVKTGNNDHKEPIDLLQTQFDNTAISCSGILKTDRAEKVKSSVEIYPNPFSNYLQVATAKKQLPYSIKDISGNLIQKGKLQGSLSRIDVKSLATGVYFLIIHDEKTDITKKIIKK